MCFFFFDVNAYESSDQSSKLSEVTINNYVYVLFVLFFCHAEHRGLA